MQMPGGQRRWSWEYGSALGRLILLALQPYPQRAVVSAFVIAIAGAAAPITLGFVIGKPWLAAVVFLSVAVALLMVAGTRIERELHGDSGISLTPETAGQWMRLRVGNERGRTAEFTATVERVHPVPPGGRSVGWVIPWGSPSGPSSERIEPYGARYLNLGAGEIARRAVDRELAGSIAFDQVAGGNIPFNYENTAELEAREPISITVKVQRHDPPATIEADYLIEFPSDLTPPVHPILMPVGESRTTRG